MIDKKLKYIKTIFIAGKRALEIKNSRKLLGILLAAYLRESTV
jgi:hypothetical protein